MHGHVNEVYAFEEAVFVCKRKAPLGAFRICRVLRPAVLEYFVAFAPQLRELN